MPSRHETTLTFTGPPRTRTRDQATPDRSPCPSRCPLCTPVMAPHPPPSPPAPSPLMWRRSPHRQGPSRPEPLPPSTDLSPHLCLPLTPPTDHRTDRSSVAAPPPLPGTAPLSCPNARPSPRARLASWQPPASCQTPAPGRTRPSGPTSPAKPAGSWPSPARRRCPCGPWLASSAWRPRRCTVTSRDELLTALIVGATAIAEARSRPPRHRSQAIRGPSAGPSALGSPARIRPAVRGPRPRAITPELTTGAASRVTGVLAGLVQRRPRGRRSARRRIPPLSSGHGPRSDPAHRRRPAQGRGSPLPVARALAVWAPSQINFEVFGRLRTSSRQRGVLRFHIAR